MTITAIGLVLSLGLAAGSGAAAPPPTAGSQPAAPARSCSYDPAPLLALSPNDFDQGQFGWRTLGERGCEAEGAEIIARYKQVHGAALRPNDLDSLNWHEGQLRAALGQNERAIPLLANAQRNRLPENQYYTDATVAFLRHDLNALRRAREQLAALPKPSGFDETARRYKAQSGREITWPLNLDVVDGLIACFGKPYSEAYSQACRPRR